MSKRRDPSIFRRLEYFEATARHGSISKAAAAMGVSPSAVSHQLSDLRRTVGEDLFVKSGRGVVLTSAGKRMADRLSTAFGILESSVATAIGVERTVVSVAACSSFGPYWLVPRLGEVREMHPDTEIELRLYGRDPELTQATADCIVTAQPVKAGYSAIDLFEERAIAVALPGLVRNGSLVDVPLITTDPSEQHLGEDWKTLANAAGITLPKEPDWLRCSHYVLALEAAKSGLGIAIVPDFVAAGAIGNGQLEDVGFGEHRLEDRTYRVCYKEIRGREAALQKVISWIKRSSRNGKAGNLSSDGVKRASRG